MLLKTGQQMRLEKFRAAALQKGQRALNAVRTRSALVAALLTQSMGGPKIGSRGHTLVELLRKKPKKKPTPRRLP